MLKNTLLTVQVDALVAQGAGNLAVRLVAAEGAAPLPPFEAGAHIDVHLPNGLVRQYSIASSPQHATFYTLCIRHENASRGGSRYVHTQLRVGDALQISAPRNLFPFQTRQRSVLMAGGIGITPMLAMAYALEHAQQAFELHYYVQKRSQAAFTRQLASRFSCGTVHLHASEEGDSIRHALPECLRQAEAEAQVYVCGPSGFMAHIQQAALAVGWSQQQLHQEAFTPPLQATAIEASQAPAAAANAPFEVQLQSSQQVFRIEPHQSIASVLVDNGIAIPLSCEMGICGACLTPVLEGLPDHRDSVQSEADKACASPQMALCCSRSHSQRLVLAL